MRAEGGAEGGSEGDAVGASYYRRRADVVRAVGVVSSRELCCCSCSVAVGDAAAGTTMLVMVVGAAGPPWELQESCQKCRSCRKQM